MDFTMYDMLLQLPLFQGLGKNDITDILTKVKFHFHHYPQDTYLVRQDDECKHVCFLLKGSLLAETESKNHTYTLYERIASPYMIELYSLFGLTPRYHSSYWTETEVNILTIDKQYLFNELSHYAVCQFNFANIICSRAQQQYKQIWNDPYGELRTRFIQFIRQHTLRPAGYKRLRTKMEDLALLLNDRRINISKMLNEMQDEKLINLRRKEIEIPALENLT